MLAAYYFRSETKLATMHWEHIILWWSRIFYGGAGESSTVVEENILRRWRICYGGGEGYFLWW